MTMMPAPLTYGDYSIRVVHGAVNPDLSNEIADFWLMNQAITDPHEAARRVDDVICVARNTADEIVGINSIYVSALNQPSQRYYFYRIFLRKQDRVLGLAARMRCMCVDYLRVHSVGSDISGVAMVTENPKLMKNAAQRMLARAGWQHVGRGPLGRDVWKIEFNRSNPV